MDRDISFTQTARVGQAVDRLFNGILKQLAATDAFSKSDTASIFIVYAHDNEQLGTANASCVIHLIQWLQEIRTRTISDRAPLPLLFYRTDDSGSVRNILSSQFCLLPQENISDDGTIHRVDKVVVCGSELLKKYYDHPFTSPFLEAIKVAWLNAKRDPNSSETPQDAIRRLVETHCLSDGFHHVLTELGLLMLRAPHNEHHKSVIPVTLDGSLMEWLPFWDSCDVVLKLKSMATGHQHQLFFKLLAQIYPQEHRLINQYKDCYELTCRELQSQSTISESRTHQIIDMAILKTQRAVSEIESAAFRGQRHLNQTRSHHETVRGVYDKLDFLTNEAETNLDEITFRRIIEWLSTCSYRLHHESVFKKVMQGSGEWITKHFNYQNWMSSTTSSTLFIHGVRGCGKSSITSVIIDQLSGQLSDSRNAMQIAYYYCSGAQSESERANPEAILRSVIRQLAVDEATRRVDPIVVSEYEKSTQHQNNISRLGINECVTLLQQLTANKTTIIAIDAIDELELLDRARLIQALKDVVTELDGVVKLLVTSRNDAQIKRLLHKATPIEVSKEHNHNDIMRFAETQISFITRSRAFVDGSAPQGLLDRITEALITGAQEMFLWVELQAQMLIRKKSVMDVVNALEQGLAENLDKIYEATYDGFRTLDGIAKAVVEGVFCWILYAKRPLTTEALNAALRLHPELTNHPADIRLPDLIDVCSNLVVLDSVTNTLRLCHPSVRDFMRHRGMFSEVQGHRLMASVSLRTCSHNFLPDPTTASTLDVIDDLSLYSAIYWPQHLKASEVSNTVPPWMMNDLDEFVLGDEGCDVDPTFEWWLSWIDQLLETLPPYHSLRLTHACLSLTEGASALPTAAVFGLSSLVELLFDSGQTMDLEKRIKGGYTPLYLACSFGHKAVASALIQNGADANVLCGEYGNPLQVACFKGHVDVIELLLDAGVSAKASSPVFKNALHAACEGGHSSAAELLIDKASIIETETDYEDALQMIAEVGFLKLYERLMKPGMARRFRGGTIDKTRDEMRILGIIKKGRVDILQCQLKADPKSEKSIPPDAVAIAALHGHASMVEYLHGLGMSIEEEGRFGSPLRSASLQGEIRVVKKLLDLRADPNAKYLKGDALQAAASKGNVVIAKLLISHGADVNQQGPPRGSSIQSAAYHGHEAMVKLLIEEDAEIYSETYKFKDALWAAMKGGHNHIGAFLQQNHPPPRGRALPGIARGDEHKKSSYFDRPSSGVKRDDSPHPESSDEDEKPQHVPPQDPNDERDQNIEDTHPIVLAAGIGNIPVLRQGLQEDHIGEDIITMASTAAAGQGEYEALEILLEEGLRHVSYLRKPKEKAFITSVEKKQPKCLEILASSLHGTITVISWGFALQWAASAGESLTKQLLEMDLIPWQFTDMRDLASCLGYSLHEDIYSNPISACKDAITKCYSSGKDKVVNHIWTWVLSKGPGILMADRDDWDALTLVAAKHADVSILDQLLTITDECEDMAGEPELPFGDLLISAVRGDKPTNLGYIISKTIERSDAYNLLTPAFLEACRTGYTQTTRKLLDYDDDFHINTDMVTQGIVEASEKGHGDLVLRLLDLLGQDEHNDALITALVSAAGSGQITVITTLLDDTDIEDSDVFSTTMTRVLVTACDAGYPDIVQLCLDQGADPEQNVEKAPSKALREMELPSIPGSVPSRFRRLLQLPRRFPRPTRSMLTTSHVQSEYNSYDFSDHKRADSDKTIEEAETNMTDALKASVCAFERISTFQSVTTGERQSATGMSKAKQQLKTVSIILDHVSDFSAYDTRLSTHPLRTAVAHGTEDLVQLLFDYGAADEFTHQQLESLILVAANRDTSTGVGIMIKLLDYDRRVSFPTDQNKCLDPIILYALQVAVQSLTEPARFQDLLSLKGIISSERAAQDLLKGGLQKLIKTIFRKLPDQSAEQDTFGDVLHAAAAAGDLAIVKLLVKHNVNVNHTRSFFHTALGSAAEFGHAQIIKELLRAGANIHPNGFVHESFGKQEPAIKAILGGHVAVLKALLDHGLEPEEYAGDVPLIVLAAQNQSAAMVDLLLQAGANPKNYPLALITAAHDGDLDMMRSLLDAGAYMNALDILGEFVIDRLLCSPLYAACKAGHTEAVKLLLQRGADAEMDSGDLDGLPLVVAARQGQSDMVQVLLDNSCDPFSRSKGVSALSPNDQRKLRKVLLDRDQGAIARGSSSVGATNRARMEVEYMDAIQSSCDVQQGFRKSLQIVNMLSNASKDPQRVFWEALKHTTTRKNVRLFEELSKHVTPDALLLNLACRCGSVNVVKLITDHGVDSMTTKQDGKTPLQVAIEYQNMDVVEVLVADRMRADTQQDSPQSVDLYFIVACILESYSTPSTSQHKSIYACERTVRKLLDISQTGVTGDPKYLDQALCLACHAGSSLLTEILLELGADINAQTDLWQGSYGYSLTPLHAAIYNTHPSVLKVLLSQIPTTDPKFDDAFQLCLSHNSPILLETFLRTAIKFEITEQHLLLSIDKETWTRSPGERNIEMIFAHHPDLRIFETTLIRLLQAEIPFSASCGRDLQEIWQTLLDKSECGLTDNIIRCIPHNRTWEFLHEYIKDCDGSCVQSPFVPMLISEHPEILR
ncbi:hypothetical protein FPOA_03850 [Fusarium poae]|uniref:NACHT domain-containing protein n=1 Tax=Fusarium poae TaxID=36050 RepID=A0A1B8ASE7_FUSPO|nr:hypothetical protein FPOA_03850 [Fusarium poae]